eukprot:12695811-Alexandrium_andersonii.AAC.1
MAGSCIAACLLRCLGQFGQGDCESSEARAEVAADYSASTSRPYASRALATLKMILQLVALWLQPCNEHARTPWAPLMP